MITCYFCEQSFNVAVQEDDINEPVAFCPFCGNEVITHEEATAFVATDDSEE